ncbi:type III secretion system export apparatus subunit SctT [Candidatus Fukatsuia symbiotica]|uniref:EscT/YscT/HrcT family type III secretion system export apparatus protein n=1 Tax=Candidatus Fukatsuia symbiotica TaxID=1878942 RepID=A0A2U8I4D3_9GAMM|nr:type III secretion system export apparatus subunit SctT [Candidatus Fukatsuia symbiotica]AWK14001.1 EscT/YscT/HrcT family type III secretion system export apparatus protein [Candidatus Fukatsuia symbiotica]MEA9445648.1 type III secretion system export apparatus subunit SctT [Candidatus Fukatsuia symbiotica]
MAEHLFWVAALALAMVRPFGMLLILPLFTARSLGSSLLRNGLVVAIALPMTPLFVSSPLITSGSLIAWFSLVLVELLIGVIIGFFAALPFWAIDMAGFLIDTMRGATMATLLNPTMGMQSSIFGILFTQVLSVLFLISGGFNQLLLVLYGSYKLLPLGQGIMPSASFFTFIKIQWRLMFELCMTFALPALLVMLLTDLALGLINRSAQQLNVFFLAMPIKSAMALFLLLIGLPFAFHHYLSQIDNIEQDMGRIIQSLRSSE